MELQLAPLRPLDDFLLKGSRFQIPNMDDEDKLVNRIASNLLYYQSNYFLSGIIIFMFVTFLHPHEMMYGCAVMALVFLLLTLAQTRKVEVRHFKARHPLLVTAAVFTAGYYFVYQIGCVAVFGMGVVVPVLASVIHATLRLRNVRNKLANATEALGLAKRTPMAFFLKEIGLEPDLKYLN